MTVREYIEKKNVIVRAATGMTLVPDDQIQECEQHQLTADDDAEACPYCQAYNPMFGECNDCPMYIGKSRCDTYYAIADEYGALVDNPDIRPALEELIRQYNNELIKPEGN